MKKEISEQQAKLEKLRSEQLKLDRELDKLLKDEKNLVKEIANLDKQIENLEKNAAQSGPKFSSWKRREQNSRRKLKFFPGK